jgi:hypothetical protein
MRLGVAKTARESAKSPEEFLQKRQAIDYAETRACFRTDPRLHHNWSSVTSYHNADRWAIPVLQGDWRVDLSEKHRGPCV